EAVYCLGDVIGYGPDPRDCLERVMKFSLTLLGNHDQAALFDPTNFNPSAERAAYWTRSQIDAPVPTRRAADRRWEFLGECPTRHREGPYLYVHGSPRRPLDEYIFPEDVYNERKIVPLLKAVERYCFHGHTHLAGVITEGLEFLAPDEIDHA